MSTIVLAAGSFLGAWVWDRVTPSLADSDHSVHPLTLAGFGDRAHLAPDTNLETHVTDIVTAIETADLRDVVLVAHSYAGAPATIAASRIPHRISRIVYIAAALPEQGSTLFDLMPRDVEHAIRQCVDADGHGWFIPVFSTEQLDTLWGDHGLTASDLAWFHANATGHPVATHQETVLDDLTPAKKLPSTYITCTGDPQHDDIDATRFTELRTLQSGHWPMITQPAELAATIEQCCAVSS